MVSAVSTTTFPNKKPNLKGDIIVENTTVVITDIRSGDSFPFTQSVDSGNIESVIINPSTAINKVHIVASILAFTTGAGSVEIREGTTSLGTTALPGSSAKVTVEVDLTNVSVGSHTYSYRILRSSGDITFNQSTGSSTNEAHFIMATLTEYADTHDTKNTNIING